MIELLAAPHADRRRRAADLATRWPYAAEVLRLYAAVLEVQEDAFEHARAQPPASLDAALREVGVRVMPRVLEAAVAAGPQALAAEAQAMLYGADLEAAAAAWLAGEELSPATTLVARASLAPVLEAVPGILPPPVAPSPRTCPACGGLPQVSVFAVSGEALLTGPRMLVCGRCATTWQYPRMACAGCGEDAAGRLPILADHDVFPHLRADACETCRTYLLTVDMPKDPAAVPLVDELAALPLDLAAKERGFNKITPNLVGM